MSKTTYSLKGLAFGLILPVASCLASTPSEEPLGLVLGGGGAKGAYQVGVWETMVETGLAPRIKVLSGTSVGAINAALFATCSDTGRMERVWLESLPKVMVPNEARIRDVLRNVGEGMDEPYLAELAKELAWRAEVSGVAVSDFSPEELDAVSKGVAERHRGASIRGALNRILGEAVRLVATTNSVAGLIDSDALRFLVRDNIPEIWPTGTPTAYATSLEKGTWNLVFWRLNEQPPEKRIEMVLASSAIPAAFDSIVVDGVPHVDGGWDDKGGDNAPIGPIVDNHPEIKTVLVVYLNDPKHVTGRIARKKHPGLNIVEIFPSRDIGQWFAGSLNFDIGKARNLIELGRSDARKKLKAVGLVE